MIIVLDLNRAESVIHPIIMATRWWVRMIKVLDLSRADSVIYPVIIGLRLKIRRCVGTLIINQFLIGKITILKKNIEQVQIF